jgi:hypothetical protein
MAGTDDAPKLPAPLAALSADGGAGRALPVALPAGRLVWPDPRHRHHTTAVTGPAYWLSDGSVTATLWARLRAEHRRSGLWPLPLEGLDDEPARPWVVGEVDPEPVRDVDEHDAAGFFAKRWAALVAPPNDGWLQELQEELGVDFLASFGRHWPGPAVPGAPAGDPAGVADRCAERVARGGTRLGLVAVDRGADALAVTGWRGPVNYFDQVSPLAAVLRSWEDRFGVRLVGVGFGTLDLSVAAPPVTFEHALHVAAEHWMFCPDNVEQGGRGLAGYAEQLCGETSWSFWWD